MATLGRWTGSSVSLVPTTSYAAPNGLFPTEDRNDSSAYTFSSSTSTLTLPSSNLADGYLIIAAVQFDSTLNNRFNLSGRITQTSGTGNFIRGESGGYARNTGDNHAYIRFWAFVDSPSAAAQFQFEWKYETTSTLTGSVGRSSIEVIPLFYSDLAYYTSTATSVFGGTTENVVTGFSGTDGTNITLASNVVTLAGDNKRYLCLGANYREGQGGRTQRFTGFEVDGVPQNDVKAYSYHRQGNEDNNGAIFSTIINRETTDIDVNMFSFRGLTPVTPNGGADVDGGTPNSAYYAMVFLELNDDCEVIRTVNNSAENLRPGSPTEIDIAATTDFNDSASFTQVNAQTINVETDADMFFGGCISGGYSTSSSARCNHEFNITVNNTEDADCFTGNYGRGNQGSQDCYGGGASLMSFIACSTGDDISVTAEQSGSSSGTLQSLAGWVGFWGLNLDTMEASGGSTITGSGAITTAAATVAGVAERILTAVGAFLSSVTEIAGTATASATVSGSGAITSGATEVDGAAERSITGSGAVPLVPVEVSGTAERSLSGIGALTLAATLVSGTAERSLVAAGALTLGATEVDGAASVGGNITGTGAIDLGASEVDGTAERSITGSGAFLTSVTEVSGTAERSLTASGAITLAAALVSGAASVLKTATGAITTAATEIAGAATRTLTGSGAVDNAPAEVDGSASVSGAVSGSGDVQPGAVEVSGTAERSLTSFGDVSLPETEVDGTGAVSGNITAAGDVQIPAIQVSGVAVRHVEGSGAFALAPTAVSGAGTASGAITGSGALEVAAVTVAGAVERIISASGDIAVEPVTVSGAGVRAVTGSGSVTIPATVVAAIAERIISGSGVIILPATEVFGLDANSSRAAVAFAEQSGNRLEIDEDGVGNALVLFQSENFLIIDPNGENDL